ncbi:hypothetical protein, partial [Mycobacterium tuberculosis]|uniref:hypothetical protein n=1 Tax=Mycobacterium tuberculosis TaxID=1773 RepID=UPI0025504FF1
ATHKATPQTNQNILSCTKEQFQTNKVHFFLSLSNHPLLFLSISSLFQPQFSLNYCGFSPSSSKAETKKISEKCG